VLGAESLDELRVLGWGVSWLSLACNCCRRRSLSSGCLAPLHPSQFTQLTLGDGLDEDTEVSLTLVESLGRLAETTGKAVVDKGGLESSALDHKVYTPSESLPTDTHLDDLLEGVLDGHGARVVGDLLDLLDLLNVGGGFRSGVRHFEWSSSTE
jgi:hypothetical protein